MGDFNYIRALISLENRVIILFLPDLMRDQQRVSQLCYGCSQCEMEKLRYALDVLKNDYKELACQVQNFVQINGLFGSTNPCA